MEIYNSRGPKQTWHQNEAKPRESKRNAPTREQTRLFASNTKELQQERIGAQDRSLARVDRWGWDSAETLLPITQIFSLLDKHVKILL